jgi:hypothetical protein
VPIVAVTVLEIVAPLVTAAHGPRVRSEAVRAPQVAVVREPAVRVARPVWAAGLVAGVAVVGGGGGST